MGRGGGAGGVKGEDPLGHAPSCYRWQRTLGACSAPCTLSVDIHRIGYMGFERFSYGVCDWGLGR
jgi:hypothetical protein